MRVHACGVCHSDSFAKEGGYPGVTHPLVPGHEIAGVIESLGDGVQDGESASASASAGSVETAATARGAAEAG